MGKSNRINHPLTKAIVNCHGKHGLSYNHYFDLFLDDCLAGFGRRLSKDQIPSKEVTAVLFELGAAYADEVIKSPPFTDILSSVYMELVSEYGQSRMGQYFTPWHVSLMMAKMLYEAPISNGKIISYCDPACGAGSMILAAAFTILESNGAEALKQYSFTGVDLDFTCARMFPLQMLANCFVHQIEVGEIVSYRGNSLGDPKELSVIIHATGKSFDPASVPDATAPQRIEAIQHVAEARHYSVVDQLGLF